MDVTCCGEFNNNFLSQLFRKGRGTTCMFPICTVCIPLCVNEETRQCCIDLFQFKKVNRNNIFESVVEFTRIPITKMKSASSETGRMTLDEWVRDRDRLWLIMLGAKLYATRCNVDSCLRLVETKAGFGDTVSLICLIQLYTINHLLAAVSHVQDEGDAASQPRTRLIYFLNKLQENYKEKDDMHVSGSLQACAFECVWRVSRRWFNRRKSYDSTCMLIDDEYFCPPFMADMDQQIGEYFRYSVTRLTPAVLSESARQYSKILEFTSFYSLENVVKFLANYDEKKVFKQIAEEEKEDEEGDYEPVIMIDAQVFPVIMYIKQGISLINYHHGYHIDKCVNTAQFFRCYEKRRPRKSRTKYI